MKDEFKGIMEIAERLNVLQKQAVDQTLMAYELEVQDIILSADANISRIERVLDALLDVAFDERVLTAYKKLCSHLYSIDESAAVFYVNSYRKMWEEEENFKDEF